MAIYTAAFRKAFSSGSAARAARKAERKKARKKARRRAQERWERAYQRTLDAEARALRWATAGDAVFRILEEIAALAFPSLDLALVGRAILRRRGVKATKAAALRAARRRVKGLIRKSGVQIYRKEMSRAIRSRTHRREGKLLKFKVKGRSRGFAVSLSEEFTSTAYHTRKGKTGQYAYVVNGGIPQRQFIAEAQQRTRRRLGRRMKVFFAREN